VPANAAQLDSGLPVGVAQPAAGELVVGVTLERRNLL
jgi:hypothetical protein